MRGIIKLALVMLCVVWPQLSYPVEQKVDSSAELYLRLGSASEGDTILLEDGVYRLGSSWAFKIDVRGLTIRGASGVRENVVVIGNGMHGKGQHGFYIDADDVTIADITVQEVRSHCIQLAPGRNRLHVMNCVLRNAGEQILKGAARKGTLPSRGSIVEGSLFEYSSGLGPRYYIGGVDVHNGYGWIVRNNTFKNIRSPGERIAEHAIHFWRGSNGTLVERNLIINCDRGIGFGMGKSGHLGGVIKDNIVFHDGAPGFNDVGIVLESSPGTKVVRNSIVLLGAYPNAIEYRFQTTRNVIITDNLVNKAIMVRDGAEAVVKDNRTVGKISL